MMHALYKEEKRGAIGRAGRKSRCSLNWMVRVGLILKGTFEQRREGVRGISQVVL